MKIEKESAKSLELTKFLWAAIFNELHDGILLIVDEGKFRLPGGQAYLADIVSYRDERWMQHFIARMVEQETGISSLVILKKTQPMMATYNTYPGSIKEEHSAVIVGRLVNCDRITKKEASFYDLIAISEMIKKGKIDPIQEKLILRVLASRDCMNKECNEYAGEKLREKHK
jgi:hypothetical protein